jgi:hypothetical protein
MAKTSNNTIKLSHKLAKAETEVCKTMIIKKDCKPPNAVHISNRIPFVKKKKKIQTEFLLLAIMLSVIIIIETQTKIEFVRIIFKFKMRKSNTV